MNKLLAISLALAVAAVLAACSGNAGSNNSLNSGGAKMQSAVPSPGAGAGRYIVVLKPGATAADVSQMGASLSARPDVSYGTVYRGFAGYMSASEVSRLSADKRVAYIEPDLPVFATPPGGKPGGGGGSSSETTGWGVDRIDADLNTGSGGSGVTVAIIDTGIDIDHPDLGDAYLGGYNFVKPGTPPEDDNGHGTHVAGIVAARKGNGIGYVGVAPNASLVALKVLDRRGSGWMSWVNGGIDWVAANASAYGIKVANMSLSAYSPSSNQSMDTAITTATAAGVVFVVAASNENTDAASYIPARFSNVICVSALATNGTFASYSNYGTVVDVIAPGSSIPSLWKSGGYNTISGTSMASPHVAGAAALWFDNHSGGFDEVYAALCTVPPSGFAEPAPSGGWGSYDKDDVDEPLVNAESL